MRIDRRSLKSLIVGRVTVVTTLLVGALVIQLSTTSYLRLEPFYLLIAVTLVLSAAYALFFRFNRKLVVQAAVQIVFDLVLVTALVYTSGGIGGNLYFLYLFVIISASLVMSGRAAYLAAALAAVFLGVLADGMYLGLIPYFHPAQAESAPALGSMLFTLFLAWTLFFVIAALMNYLSRNLRKAWDALAAARRELELKERQAAAGRMSALIAHEIRNPLAAISGAVQVLRSDLRLDAEQARLMDIVVGESRRVSTTIDQFLQLASPAKESTADFDLAVIARETVTMLRVSGGLGNGIEVRGSFETDRVPFRGSPGMFKQITWNLVRNAVQAMPGGGTLTIDFPPAGDGAVAIRFADTGKGMTPEERARMFEPFYSRFEGGRGLGMAVVERFVSDARGSIVVNTAPGAGTSIVLEFPRAADAVAGTEKRS
jgi:two-component system sensor histidine kinase PilS (NtrC family)